MIGMYYRNMILLGSWTVRVVTLVLPREQVAAMLSPGLELGPQTVTPPGTHPLRLYFAAPMAARMNFWPPAALNMHDYREHVIGIPFTYRSSSLLSTAKLGPFYFTPRLLLDNWGSSLGGNLFWAFEKELVFVESRRDAFCVRDLYDQRPLMELRWRPNGPWRPALHERNFSSSLEIMNQPLVMRTLWCADFRMHWSTAKVRSIRARLRIHEPYVPHMPTGQFDSPGLRSSVIGAHELRVSWETTMPYYPEFAPLLQLIGARVG